MHSPGVYITFLVITCDEQEPVPNGAVECTKGSDYSSICTVVCNAGYETDEDTEVECTADHTWDDYLPSCISKYTLLLNCFKIKKIFF